MTIFEEIRRWLASTGVSQADMGRAIAHDRGYITKLLNDQLTMTADRAQNIRQWMFDHPDFDPAKETLIEHRVPSGISINADFWMRDARNGSVALAAAIAKHHPERCAA